MKKEIYSGIIFAFFGAPVLGSEEVVGAPDSITEQAEVRQADPLSTPKAERSDSGAPISSSVQTSVDLISFPHSGQDTFVGPTTCMKFPGGMTAANEPAVRVAPPPVDVKKCCGWW